ncbi:pilus assembly protein [Frateuria sp. Soil773]|uniref:type II secretion system F family protein n=1 Tax=Frateuria sp. Soil773 TaxID=1736407 RepID=UPI0006F1D104|nr:type II secretion system F family protein [Frateuria sp. Soil773]KRF02110.1 pilus assembly protein [Frateuria sp. Soil773]
MTLALVLLSAVSLLLAGAIELWWGSPLRQQQRKSLAHLEKNLAAPVAAANPAAAGAAGAAAPARQPGELVTDPLCLRAGLPTGWRVPGQIAALGLLLTVLGAWRIGTAWAWPVLLAVYAAMAWLWLRARIEKLRRQLVRQLPDFLDAMVRLASIGNSLPMAFQTAAASVQAPLRGVLDQTMRSVRTGLELDRALQLAARPYRLEALDLLHVVLGTGVRMGGRADHILQRMSDFMRDLDHAQQELRAITSETRMSAWVLGLLPIVVAIFMSLLNPAFFHPMFTHPLGHKILLIAAVMELIGGFLLYRLARSL